MKSFEHLPSRRDRSPAVGREIKWDDKNEQIRFFGDDQAKRDVGSPLSERVRDQHVTTLLEVMGGRGSCRAGS